MTAAGGGKVVGVLLAGGQARRMGGGDKGRRLLAGREMLSHVIETLTPQVSELILNANGDPARFDDLGFPVVADPITDHPGPLAGVLAGLQWTRANRPDVGAIATISTDAPFLPQSLVRRLTAAFEADGGIPLAQSAGQLHPVIGLWPTALADDLAAALADGVRKVLHWTDRHGTTQVPFPLANINGHPVDPFFNVNTAAELAYANAILDVEGPIQKPPAIGIVGWKSSGKTTLTSALISELTRRGLKVHAMKHAHHGFRVDDDETDSARHRRAGAAQVGLRSGHRWAIVSEAGIGGDDAAAFADLLGRMGPADLIVVEGFKSAAIPKIEVRRRAAREQTPISERDPEVIAIAADHEVATAGRPTFALDDIEGLADFVVAQFDLGSRRKRKKRP